MKSVTVRVPEEVYDALGRRAHLEDRSMSSLVVRALESFLFSEVKIVYLRTEVLPFEVQ